ncbi:MAG: hypothetical protein U5K51_01915 [Flavobacteriaceae bacterium]|nr:hypothetical protein [Flavobacteriaceae bacterium]
MRKFELKHILCFFFILLFLPDLSAQITIPYKKEALKDSIQNQQDTDTAKMALPAVTEEKEDPYIEIKKSVLDSLLNPFYSFSN